MKGSIYILALVILSSHLLSQKTWKRKMDSLRAELKKEQPDTVKAKLNYLIGYILTNEGSGDSAYPYILKALEFADASDFVPIKVKANKELGYFYMNLGEIDSSYKYFARGISFITEDIPEYYDIFGGIGTICFYKGNHVKSYEYYLRGLKCAERSGESAWIAKACGNVGVALKEQNKFDDALVFFNKALGIARKNNLKELLYVSLTNTGNIYSEKFEKSKSKYDAESALKFYLEAKSIVMEMLADDHDRSNAITLLGNIGNVYADLGDYNKAVEVFRETISMMEGKIFLGDRSMLYTNFASVYVELKKVKEAEKYLSLAKKEALDSGSPSALMENYKTYALLNEVKGNYKDAYHYHWRYKQLSDSLFSTEMAEKRKEIELNAEFAQKERETKLLQDKKEALAKEEKKKQKIVLYAFVVGFILMIIVAFQFYKSYRNKKKSNEIITLQKAEVEKQKELVELKQKEILDSIHYARRIQTTHLPSNDYIDKNMSRLKS